MKLTLATYLESGQTMTEKTYMASETFVGIIDKVEALRIDNEGIVLDLVQPNGAFLRLHLLSEEAEAISQTLGTALHDIADGDTVEQKVGKQ